ncbi:MAG: restriction endonuclease subunit S [Candidatus Reddybacter sp.]
MAAVDVLITEQLDIWASAIRSKSGVGRGSSKKRELYGIKKLRGLILELAVRGLLVPQDPNDEPASELLKKIAAEKEQLLKDKRIKKQKNLLPISDEEKPFELPMNWSLARLGYLSHLITKGTTPTSIGYTFEDSGVSFLKIENLDNGRVDKKTISQFISEDTNNALARSQLCSGDLLFSIAGTIGKTAIIYDFDLPANTNQALAIIRGTQAVYLPSYLRIQLDSFVAEKTRQKARGGAMPNVSLGDLTVLVSPIPPLAEQHRIVAKVDKLMALCDQLEQQTETSLTAHQTLVETVLAALTRPTALSGSSEERAGLQTAGGSAKSGTLSPEAILFEHFDTLFTTQHSIDQLKQTILQLAVMGKLAPQNPNDEPASELLKKIAAKKEQLLEDKKIKKQKPLPSISDEEKPFELPEGWGWCHLDDLALHSEAGWSPKCENIPRERGKWGVLKVSAVTWGEFRPDQNKQLPSHLESKPEYEVKENDFLISRANTAELVARSVIVPDDSEKYLMMSDKIIRFSFSDDNYPEYINLVNNSLWSRQYYSRVAGGTSSSMKNVSRKQIQMLCIGLPPLKEQHRIVAKVNKLMALCDQLKARLNEAQITQLHLADALAEQAVG